jgi:hypothetical protein
MATTSWPGRSPGLLGDARIGQIVAAGAKHREIGCRVTPMDLGRRAVTIHECHRQALRAPHDVLVGEQVAIRRYEDARPFALTAARTLDRDADDGRTRLLDRAYDGLRVGIQCGQVGRLARIEGSAHAC